MSTRCSVITVNDKNKVNTFYSHHDWYVINWVWEFLHEMKWNPFNIENDYWIKLEVEWVHWDINYLYIVFQVKKDKKLIVDKIYFLDKNNLVWYYSDDDFSDYLEQLEAKGDKLNRTFFDKMVKRWEMVELKI